MGDSQNAYFVGREAPAVAFPKPVLQGIPGGDPAKLPGSKPIRDVDDKLAKQAARFRIFCYYYDDLIFRDEHPEEVWEVTDADYEIEWRVKVANLKSPDYAAADPQLTRQTNEPDEVTLKTSTPADFNTLRRFTGKPGGRFELGSAFLDTGGRLLVLGSNGKSEPIPGLASDTQPGLRWKNWQDDAADGYVQATVTPRNGSSKKDAGEPAQPARQAWVVINMPHYGMDVRPSVTLYDLALTLALANTGSTRGWCNKNYYSAPLTYHRNVAPTLQAYIASNYVDPVARSSHANDELTFLSPPPNSHAALFAALMRPSWDPKTRRPENIFVSYDAANVRWRNRDPSTPIYDYTYDPITGDRLQRPDGTYILEPLMPKLLYLALPQENLQWIKDWMKGTVAGGTPLATGSPIPSNYSDPGVKDEERPWLLDLAHMNYMSGGSFFPGIEVGRDVAFPAKWRADWGALAYHVDIRWTGTTPGEMTQNLAVPWQADFVACTHEYWPASRPIQVKGTGPNYYDWMNDGVADIDAIDPIAHRDLLTHWAEMGFIRYDAAADEFQEDPNTRLIGHPVGAP